MWNPAEARTTASRADFPRLGRALPGDALHLLLGVLGIVDGRLIEWRQHRLGCDLLTLMWSGEFRRQRTRQIAEVTLGHVVACGAGL